MNTSGQYIQQLTGYKAFIPSFLPLHIQVDIDRGLLKATEIKLAQLEGVSAAIPNPQLFISMYVRKEALLSSQIEGTQWQWAIRALDDYPLLAVEELLKLCPALSQFVF